MLRRSARMIAGVEDNQQGILLYGLKLKLKKGWKIYWRNPGEAGLPPKIKLRNTKNFKKVELLFPSPRRFNFFGIETFRYENEIIFPVKIYKNFFTEPLNGILQFNAQICNNICIHLNILSF